MPLGAFKAALMGTAGATVAGDVVLLSSQTASDSASISFTSGINSTYGEYIFKFYNIHPESDGTDFTFQVNATDGADYNDSAITSTWFDAFQEEDGSPAQLSYRTALDLAQGTGYQTLGYGVGGGTADESIVGELHLFNPSSTTYVKHFFAKMNMYHHEDGSRNAYIAGYINDTTAIDDIQFKMVSDNLNGTIKMWGVK